MNTTYWTGVEEEALTKITTFEEMVPVGISILQRMSESNKKIIQICGPMSTGGQGSLETNMAYFKKAVVTASQQGLCIFDQTPFQDTMVRLGADWTTRREYCIEILHIFYRGIFKSGLIKELIFLPDWQSSIGAKWEREEGQKLGLVITEFPQEWLQLIK